MIFWQIAFFLGSLAGFLLPARRILNDDHDGAGKGSSSALSLSSLLFSSLLLPSLFSLSLSSFLLLSSLLFSLSAVNHPEKGVGAPPGASVNIGLLETLELCSVKILIDSRYDLTTAGCQVRTDDVHTHKRPTC